MSNWTQEEKDLAVKLYVEICENEYETDEQRSENATAIVSQVAEQLEGKTVNGVRVQLSTAGVYIAQKPKAKAASAGGAKSGGSRATKADLIQGLKEVILTATPEGTEIDEAILDKLTGKAAAHLTELFIATQGA